jgi:hypothetical protein
MGDYHITTFLKSTSTAKFSISAKSVFRHLSGIGFCCYELVDFPFPSIKIAHFWYYEMLR